MCMMQYLFKLSEKLRKGTYKVPLFDQLDLPKEKEKSEVKWSTCKICWRNLIQIWTSSSYKSVHLKWANALNIIMYIFLIHGSFWQYI